MGIEPLRRMRWRPLLLTAVLLLGGMRASAGPVPELRVLSAYSKFDDTHLLAAAWSMKSPAAFRASRLDVAAGSIVAPQNNRAFVSAGPVWRLGSDEHRLYLDFGFSPTLLAGSRLGERDLGGSLHFTSSLAVGRAFGRSGNIVVALRLQHLSNGGLDSTNPGLDTIGIGFAARSR